MSKQLKDIIDNYYLNEKKDRIQTRFYISEAGKCPRQVFIKFKNFPKEVMEPNFLRLFDHGDHIHQLIMKSLFSSNEVKVIASEINIPTQDLVSGRTDAIIEKEGELFVLDIKSMNSMAFDKMKEAKEDNVKQVQLYLYYFNIKKGILLYVNKDNLKLKEYEINYNQEEVEKILNELIDLRNKINSDIVPPRLKGYPTYWECRYCKYKKVCDMAELNEGKWDIVKEKLKK